MSIVDRFFGTSEDAEHAMQTPPTATDVFTALSNERRQHAITHVHAHGTTRLGTLAEHIAARETNTTVEQVGSDARKAVYVGLYQGHLDHLDAHGLVDVDDRNRVHPGPFTDLAVELLESGRSSFIAATEAHR